MFWIITQLVLINSQITVIHSEEAPKISLIIQSPNVLLSKSMILACSMTGYPTPSISWKFNDSPIAELKSPVTKFKNTPRIFSINNYQYSVLIIKQLLMSDSDSMLICEAENSAGSDYKQHQLKVISSDIDLPTGFPMFQNNFFPIIKPYNSNVTLVCQAHGNPPPMIQWFKNYELINESFSRTKILNDGNLLLIHITREDKGIYHCQAQNTNGLRLSDPSTLDITSHPVSPKSVIIEKFGSDNVDISWQSGINDENESENFILHYKEISDNITENKMKSKFVYLPITEKKAIYKYNLKDLFPYTTYHMWMESENPLGVSQSTNILIVRTLPTVPQLPPRSITATSISNTAIVVAWKPPERKFGKFKYYQIIYTNNDGFRPQHWRQFSAKEDNVMLTHLMASELYHIRVKIVNEIGHGPLSKTISITTIAGTLSQCPDFKMTEIFQSHIRLQWNTPDPVKLFKHIQYNLQCWDVRLKIVNATVKSTSLFPILNQNLSMNEMEYILFLKNEKEVKCRLCAINTDGEGMPTEIQASTINNGIYNQNLIQIVKVGSSFVNFIWRPPSKFAFDYFLWVYRIFDFIKPEKYPKLPKIKINISDSASAENEWFVYNYTNAFSSSNYILGLRYLCRDSHDILREYVYRSDLIVTLKSVPSDSPKDLAVNEIDFKSARLSWKPITAVSSNGIITHYEVRYYAAQKEESTEKFINVSETSVILSNLKYFHYVIYVRAFTKVGGGSWSNPYNYYRQNLAEFPVPTKIKAERKSETEINISWELPVLSENNKAHASIEGFMIQYSLAENSPKWINHILQSKKLSAVIEGLKPDLKYQFKIAATNYAGLNGNFSDVVEEMPKDFPKLSLKTVPDVRCSVQSSNKLKVEWPSPSIATDLLKFEIYYSGNLSYITEMGLKKSEYIDHKSKTVAFEKNVKLYDVTLEDLQSNALYKISVLAIYQNKELYESRRETICETRPAVPDLLRPPFIIGVDEEKSKVIIKLHRCSQRNGKISNYFVIVAAFQSHNNRQISLLHETELYTFMELSVNTRSNNVKGEYIAIMRDINNIFRENGKDHSNVILGDGSHDDNHLSFNKKLEKDFNYRCFVRVCLKYSNNSLCKSSPWSQAFRITDLIHNRNSSISSSKSLKDAYSNSLIVIIFLVVGVILAIASIVIGCIVKRKKSKERFMHLGNHDDIRSSIGMKSSMLNGLMSADKIFISSEVDESFNCDKKYTSMTLKPDIKSIPDLVNADSVQMCQDGTKLSPILMTDSKKLRINSQKSENIAERPSISICNLYQYVTDLKANESTLLQAEFETLNTNLDDRFTWHRSNIDSNKSKNRYANVVAYDHTSVLLTPLDDIIGSDYINANYIDGYQKQNAYIATQGPLPDTTDDFWRMVWEQRSNCIVMMTRLEERSGIKCHQYWPNRGFICYGQMIVSHIDTFLLAYYTIRIFEIRHSKYSEKREIQHFQFTAWPDHGVPKLSTPLLMFIRRVRSIGKIETGPKIVHCSAGVGRTGAFIVVDAQLERIKQEKSVDVFNYVSKIRCQRNYMVQTQAQYQFILETLLEAVEDGNTEVMACNFHAHVTKLSQIGISGSNQLSGFEMEFSKLNSLASNRGRHGVMLADFVKAAGNQTVNMTKNRVRNIIPYEWNRVVLNAIRGIEGSDYINASYIDGYRERRAYIAAQSPIPSTVEDFWRMLWDQHCGVVIVLNQPLEDKSHIYWPINKSIRYQFFVVDPVVEYNMPNYILREFKVTDARDGEFRALRQFQFTQWPTHGCPKESESILDFIRQVHKTKEQFGHMEPMVIHCNTGSGRTGVFIALSIVLDRLQQESVVDMYQTVKLLHKQRIGLVQTEEQYEFCYMAVLDYLSNYEKMMEKSHLY